MKMHRYTQLLVPLDRYLKQLTPRAKKLVSILEGGLLLVLLGSVMFYVG